MRGGVFHAAALQLAMVGATLIPPMKLAGCPPLRPIATPSPIDALMRTDAEPKTLTSTLGPSALKDADAIRRRFKELAVELHPDRASPAHAEEATARFQALSEEYNRLLAECKTCEERSALAEAWAGLGGVAVAIGIASSIDPSLGTALAATAFAGGYKFVGDGGGGGGSGGNSSRADVNPQRMLMVALDVVDRSAEAIAAYLSQAVRLLPGSTTTRASTALAAAEREAWSLAEEAVEAESLRSSLEAPVKELAMKVWELAQQLNDAKLQLSQANARRNELVHTATQENATLENATQAIKGSGRRWRRPIEWKRPKKWKASRRCRRRGKGATPEEEAVEEALITATHLKQTTAVELRTAETQLTAARAALNDAAAAAAHAAQTELAVRAAMHNLDRELKEAEAERQVRRAEVESDVRAAAEATKVMGAAVAGATKDLAQDLAIPFSESFVSALGGAVSVTAGMAGTVAGHARTGANRHSKEVKWKIEREEELRREEGAKLERRHNIAKASQTRLLEKSRLGRRRGMRGETAAETEMAVTAKEALTAEIAEEAATGPLLPPPPQAVRSPDSNQPLQQPTPVPTDYSTLFASPPMPPSRTPLRGWTNPNIRGWADPTVPPLPTSTPPTAPPISTAPLVPTASPVQARYTLESEKQAGSESEVSERLRALASAEEQRQRKAKGRRRTARKKIRGRGATVRRSYQ